MASSKATDSHSDTPWNLGYRRELDGLRGLAIILVFVSHFALNGMAGGLAGVTLFFVLSGFLITSLLLTEQRDTGAISLRAFYGRRARRLLPALVVTVTLVTIGQFLIQAPGAGWHGLAAMSYVANWVTILSGDIGALEHTWSLAVEEQFYLLWPALLVLSASLHRRWLMACLLAGVALSVIGRLAMVASGASVERIAYGSDMRADAILLGAALAVALVSGNRLPRVPAAVAIPALLIVSLLTWYTDVGMTVGLFAVAALSLAAIAASLDGVSWLTWRPLVRTGRISYGLYLYHAPLLVIFAPPLALIFTVLAAEVSFRWLESPFLRGRAPVSSSPIAGAINLESASPART